jgi:hypothetical protein
MNPAPDLCVLFGPPAVGKRPRWAPSWRVSGDFPYPAQHLVLDTEVLDPAGCASAVLLHAPLARE